ncbi:BIR-domain-containing protein [Aureobasidium namibiae CBS 147.97]|uniref:BIR-domain-containing protein n=1 Tax=Aureobasidium namibiae CBS 147.97 TaxID=1043004 RepID=A0A074XF23_9PEZI
MAAVSGLDMSMLTYTARLATFNTEHQLTKRRASSQKKKQPSAVSWPHEAPSGEELARAGFFFKPAPDSDDNAQCFHCAVKLDGWESQDVPLQEHLAHSAHCSYALSLSVSDKAEERDPMCPELKDARTSTFGDMWPHEHKKGWKPKVKQMVEAGWTFDPSPADEDGATCFYCNMSLDGWEPKDSPLEEHRRREPNCLFFALMDRYKSTRRKGGRGRASTASKASRLSTQSVQSTFSEAPSLMSLGDAGPQLDVEDSIALDTTISSDAGKGRKKTTKAKKKTSRQASVEPSVQYPTLQDAPQAEDDIYEVPIDDEPMSVIEQPKPKRGRKAKNAQDSTIIDDSIAEPAQKPTRGRKKAKEPSPPPVETSLDESQLQAELQEAAEDAVVAESPPTKSGRGVKRTTDGVEKAPFVEDEILDEQPTKAKKAAKSIKAKKTKKAVKDTQDEVEDSIAVTQPEVKPKRTRSKKTKKAESEPDFEAESGAVAESAIEVQTESIIPVEIEKEQEPEEEAFERNFEIADSNAGLDNQVQAEAQQQLEEEDFDHENLEPPTDAEENHTLDHHEQQDEDVLDEEFNNLENENAEEAVADDNAANEVDEEEEEQPASIVPTPAAEEFEPTPTPDVKRHSAVSMSSVQRSVIQRATSEEAEESAHSTPRSARSPQQSDAENQPPSSTHAPPTAQKATPALSAMKSAIQPREIFASPTKTTRVPLAASTPNRSPRRPPSKFDRLTSTTAWEPVDLESVFFPDSENEAGDADDVFNKLLEVGGALTSQEKKMTVEEWIRSRAELGELKLKNECERMVMLFEKEGNRGLAALSGIQTSS